MGRLALHDMQKRYFIVGFLIVVVIGGLFWGLTPVYAAPVRQEVPTGQDNSGRSCAECHLDNLALWSEGVHSKAYTDQIFQDAWQSTLNDPICLQCHTTNFQPSTGTYDHENIQCEACHGTNPANHPPEPVVVNTEAEICGDCHTATFNEWRHSFHSFNEDMGAIGCATCHEPHSQKIRFDTIDELCLNCHKDNPDNPQSYTNSYVHVTHNEIQFETVDADVSVTCADCHMFTYHPDELHSLPDHSTNVTTRPCTDCHEMLSETGQFDTLLDVDTVLAEERDALRVQVSQLEDELTAAQTSESESSPNFVTLTQGIIVGLGLGITVLWVILRQSNGSSNGNGKSKDTGGK